MEMTQGTMNIDRIDLGVFPANPAALTANVALDINGNVTLNLSGGAAVFAWLLWLLFL
jgi:hypothetical protein